MNAPLVPAAAPPPAPALPFTEATTRRLGPIRRFFLRRPVAMDVLVVLVFVVPAVLFTVFAPADGYPDGSEPRALDLVFALVGGAVLLFRRRLPLVAACVMGALTVLCTALTGTIGGFDLGIAFMVYVVAASYPARIGWLVLAGLDLLAIGSVWLWEEARETAPEGVDAALEDPRVGSITGIVIVSLAAIAIGISVRNRRLHIAELVERGNALARDRDQQAQIARANERSRIAREMHDVVAHSLSVMIALADGAGAALEKSPDRSRAALTELSATGRSALGDMRRVLGVLQEDAPLEPQPGSTDLAQLVERFRATGLPVRTQGLHQRLPDDAGLQLAVYRIVQEALTNALRHAPGTTQVDVSLEVRPEGLELEVVDRGATVPVPDAGGAGQGLIGMRERAGVYGGTVEAGPWRGGWRVHAVLPWQEGRA